MDLERRLPAWQWPFIAHLAIERQAEVIAAFLDHDHPRFAKALLANELSTEAMQRQMRLERAAVQLGEHLRQVQLEQLPLLED